MELLRASYRLDVPREAAEARAEAVSREQTVEVPRSVVRDAFVEREILGRVESVREKEGGFLARIAYPAASCGNDPAHTLCVLFGNVSLQDDVTLVDLELPPSLLGALGGPRFGLEGLRKATGVHDRPLTCTALKPLGLPVEELARLCATFARAGVDVIKDDQGLGDQFFCPFEERVRACQRAVERVADATGHRAVYAANLSGSPSKVFRELEFAEACGVRAVMLSPMLLGLPGFWEVCRERASVPVLAHPGFGGAGRIAPEVLFGRIYRLYGADAVIFTHFGGRFAWDAGRCRAVAGALLEPWGPIRPALPVPGGGITTDRVREVAGFYGRDVMLLVGGSLLEAPDPDALLAASRCFVDQVREAGGEGAG